MTVHAFPALGFDPAPGEPDELADLARDCTAFAVELHDDAQRAVGLQSGYTWDGKAAEAFRDRLKDVPRDLTRAGDAQHQAGAALASFSALLSGHQSQARAYEQQAAVLVATARDPANQVAAPGSPAGTKTPACVALEALAQVQLRADTLRTTVQSQARSCNDAVHAATQHAPKPPGFFSSALGAIGDFAKSMSDKVGAFVRDHAGFIAGLADICSKISSALAIVAMMVGPIPILGEAVGAVAFAGAIATGLVALGGHALLATYAGGSWKPVVFDAVAVAATYAGGRGVTTAATKLGAANGWDLGASESMSLRTALTTLRTPGAALTEGSKSETTFARLVTRTVAFQFDGTAGSMGVYDLAGLSHLADEVKEAGVKAQEVSTDLRESSLSSSSDLSYATAHVGGNR